MKLVIKNLYKKLDNESILEDVSLSISLESNIFIFTGENGSGKSTFFKLLSGIIVPDKGSIEINENRSYYNWIKENSFYLPPGDRGLIYRLNGLNNIKYLISLKGKRLTSDLTTLYPLAEELNCMNLLTKKAYKMSSGEKKKIQLLATLVGNFKIVFLDEPTSFLDIESIKNLSNILNKLSYTDVFIITHDQFLIHRLKGTKYSLVNKTILEEGGYQ